MANSATSQDNQRGRLTMNEILQSLGMTILSQKSEDERVDFNVIMSASDEDLIRLAVRTIGDRVRLRDACRRVYTRSSTSITLGDTHRTSSNRSSREERALLFSPSVRSTGTGERRTGSRRRQSKANIYGISNINMKRKGNCKVLEPIEVVMSAKKFESSSKTRENIHPSNTKILICYSPKV